MSILLLLVVLLASQVSHAEFVIQLPIPAHVDTADTGQLWGWATFACPQNTEPHWGFPSGPVGDPPSLLLTFHDYPGDNCLAGPWWSYPYITDGEIHLCDTTYHIGSEIQLHMVWSGNYVLDVEWPECRSSSLPAPLRPGSPILLASPNPFNPVVWLESHLSEPGAVRLAVHDLQGREVAVLADGFRPAGIHRDAYRGDGQASGLYIVHLETAQGVATTRILLMK